MSRLFGHGDLRLWILKLLNERPRHGYDIIAALEEQFLGLYSPSPGTVYPRLAALEEDGLIEQVDGGEGGEGRKVYRLTEAGRAELARRQAELRELGERLASSARRIAEDVRSEVRAAVRHLRSEIRRAASEVRREERRAARLARQAREAALGARERFEREVRSAREAALGASGELRAAWRNLEADLDGFVADVVAAARRHRLDGERLASLERVLREAKAAVIEVLCGSEGGRKA